MFKFPAPNALQPHATDVIEHGRAVTRQMLNELDGAPLALPVSLASRRLRLIRQVAQVVN